MSIIVVSEDRTREHPRSEPNENDENPAKPLPIPHDCAIQSFPLRTRMVRSEKGYKLSHFKILCCLAILDFQFNSIARSCNTPPLWISLFRSFVTEASKLWSYGEQRAGGKLFMLNYFH